MSEVSQQDQDNKNLQQADIQQESKDKQSSSVTGQEKQDLKSQSDQSVGSTESLSSQEKDQNAENEQVLEQEFYDLDLEKAESFKAQGNSEFQQQHFQKALNLYSEAIKYGGSDKKASVYYSNRAFCHLKLEAYGSAIEDAKKSTELDPSFVKGYYRLGCAYMSLMKIDQAKESFFEAFNLSGKKDKSCQEKYAQAKKMIFEREFQKAVEREDDFEKFTKDFKNLVVPSDYKGPSIENDSTPITPEWCVALMDHLKDQKKLHKKYLVTLLLRAKKILTEQPPCVEFNYPDDIEMTVCGDTHGQFYDLLNIFKLNGNPSETTPYLFNGDFVDRGSFSVEVITTLLAWKVALPESMHLTRGNHETINMNKMYGFEGEVVHKYDNDTFNLFTKIFQALPLAYILNGKVQVNHGGLFQKDNVKISDLKTIDRFSEPPDSGLFTDLLWSDPVKMNGRHPSKRGVSIGFGPDIAKKYLAENNLNLLVRSHEMKQEGYEEEADGKVITIFSAPNYCDQMGNKGAFIRFLGKDMKPKYTQFTAVDHPKVPPMAYSRAMGMF